MPSGGLIGFLLWLRNRKIKNIENVNENKTIVQVEDEEKYESNPRVIALFSNVKIRTSIQKVITEPLTKEGISSFVIRKDNEEMIVKKKRKKIFSNCLKYQMSYSKIKSEKCF